MLDDLNEEVTVTFLTLKFGQNLVKTYQEVIQQVPNQWNFNLKSELIRTLFEETVEEKDKEHFQEIHESLWKWSTVSDNQRTDSLAFIGPPVGEFWFALLNRGSYLSF